MIVGNIKPTGTEGIEEFIFIQGLPSVEWLVNHNLNCHPRVTVLDSSNRQVEGDVKYQDLNTVIISFSSGFSGKAILR